MKRKCKSRQHLFTLFGIDVNLSAVLTTVVGSLTWLLISTGLSWIHDLNTNMQEIKMEQARIKQEYAPEVKRP